MKQKLILPLAALFLLLSACGQSGPLYLPYLPYLPDQPTNQTRPAEKPPTPSGNYAERENTILLKGELRF